MSSRVNQSSCFSSKLIHWKLYQAILMIIGMNLAVSCSNKSKSENRNSHLPTAQIFTDIVDDDASSKPTEECPTNDEPSFATDARPLINSYCIGCHNTHIASGSINFSTDPKGHEVFGVVAKINSSINSKKMPPNGQQIDKCIQRKFQSYVEALFNSSGDDQKLCNITDPISFDTHAKPLLLESCVSCHNAESGRLRLDIEDDPTDLRPPTLRFRHALEAIDNGSMPPNEGQLPNICALNNFRQFVESLPDDSDDANCNEDTRPNRQLQFLSPIEYRNVVTDLFGEGLVPILNSLEELFPKQTMKIYDGLDTKLNLETLLAFNTISEAVARQLVTEKSAILQYSTCANNWNELNSDRCFRAFIGDVGLFLHRRPLDNDEISRYFVKFNPFGSYERYRLLITAMLQSPKFLYRFESYHSESDKLDGYEIASRLAFGLWKTTPDRRLLSLAANGDLEDPAQIELTVSSMLADKKGERSLLSFFRRWLHVDSKPVLFQKPFYFEGLNPATYANDALNELDDYIKYVLNANGHLRHLFSSNAVKISSENMSKLFGLPVSDQYQISSDGRRSSLIQRPAFLLQKSETSNPVTRGHIIREDLLCEPLQVPQMIALAASTNQDANDDFAFNKAIESNREHWEGLTGQGECANCHKLMNPLGYTLEEYDTLGRFRSIETKFADDGAIVAQFNIDTQSVPQIERDDKTIVKDSKELAELLANAKKLHHCFAIKAFRYIYQSTESSKERCLISKNRFGQKRSETSILDIFKDYAIRPEFFKPRKKD